MCRRHRGEAGFSLPEVLVSMVIMATALVGMAQLFALSTRVNYSGKGQTSTGALAQEKLEQLRALTWGFDNMGLPYNDTTTNLSMYPPTTNGPGMTPAPGGTLDTNTMFWVDYLDEFGDCAARQNTSTRWDPVTNACTQPGTTAPTSAVYVRRWTIDPLPIDPNDSVILQVSVTNAGADATALLAKPMIPRSTYRVAQESRLITMKTRKGS